MEIGETRRPDGPLGLNTDSTLPSCPIPPTTTRHPPLADRRFGCTVEPREHGHQQVMKIWPY